MNTFFCFYFSEKGFKAISKLQYAKLLVIKLVLFRINVLAHWISWSNWCCCLLFLFLLFMFFVGSTNLWLVPFSVRFINVNNILLIGGGGGTVLKLFLVCKLNQMALWIPQNAYVIFPLQRANKAGAEGQGNNKLLLVRYSDARFLVVPPPVLSFWPCSLGT